MTLVTANAVNDSVSIHRFGDKIELRIGDGQGSRYTFLTPRQARKVAIALIDTSESPLETDPVDEPTGEPTE